MLRSFTITRVRGIEIRIHPSFLLVLLWVAFHWGVMDDRGVSALIYGAILVFFIFCCVVLHELGHSFMAIHYGVKVHDITLLPIGGVARLEHLPARPASEALIALAGPLTNVAIAVALVPPLLLLGVLKGYDSLVDYLAYVDDIALGGLLIYLFFTNIMLFLFNLLPAFPMDGGRVVRAGLSAVVGRERATRFAVLLGQAAAVALAIFGIWWGDYLLPLISLFIIAAAYAEGRAVRLESAMRRLRVGQFALWDMGGISAHHPLTYALRGGPRDVVVTDGSHVIGMLWRHQLLPGLNGGTASRTVADVMDRDIVSVDIDASVYDVQQKMHELDRWAMPVTEDGQYRGIFTADRFVHVYRYLNTQAGGSRLATSWAVAISNAFRGLVR
ncbi:MAG: site-2 protease family protein [Thermomicrobiales bacterium]